MAKSERTTARVVGPRSAIVIGENRSISATRVRARNDPEPPRRPAAVADGSGKNRSRWGHWNVELKQVGEVDRDDCGCDGEHGRDLSGPAGAQALTPKPPISPVDCRVETRHGDSRTEEEDCRVVCGDRARERDGEYDPRPGRDASVRRIDEVEIRAKGDQQERDREHVAAYGAPHDHGRHGEAESQCTGQRESGRAKNSCRDSADHIGCRNRGGDREGPIHEPVGSNLRHGAQQQIKDRRMRVDVHVPPETRPRRFAGDEDVPPAVVLQALIGGHVQHWSRSAQGDRRQQRARAARFIDVDHSRVRDRLRSSADAASSTLWDGASLDPARGPRGSASGDGSAMFGNAATPDFGPDWQLRFQFLFPR